MAKTIIQALASNAALLLVLSFLYVQIFRRWESKKFVGQVLNGILFGGVAIGVMLSPLNLLPGVVFDTRSVVISVGALFGGPLVAIITFIMASAFRIWQGGAGALMGVLVSFFSAALGTGYFFWKRHSPQAMRAPYLYGFGVLVHLVMLTCALALPGDMTWRVLADISLPVIIIYPLATLLLCLLISEREARITSARLLQESEGKYRSIVDMANEGIWVTDDSLMTTFVNARMAEMMGYSQAEMLGRPLADFVFDEDQADLRQRLQMRREGEKGQYERRLRRNDGSSLWVLVSAAPMYEKGVFSGSLAMYTDIGDRKRAEGVTLARINLLESSTALSVPELLRATLDEVCALTNSPIGFCHFIQDDQKTIGLTVGSTRTAGEFCKIQVEGSHHDIEQAGVWADCIHQRRPVIHNDYASLPHRKGLPPGHAEVIRELVVPILRQDKIVAVIGVGNKPTDYAQGDVDTVNYLADVAWEIAERKRSEEALRQSEELFRLAFHTSPDAININRLEDGLYVDINDGFTRLTGFTREDVLGRTSEEISVWHDMQDRAKLVAGLRLSGYYENLEAQFRRKDGSLTTALMSARTIMLHGVPHILSITRDILERKRAEEEKARLEAQLRQAQKMEAIGTLAGGIAHDFNNILGAIMGYTELAMELAEDGVSNGKELEQVIQAADKARNLVKQILTFSRKGEADLRPLNLNKTIRDNIQMLEHSLPKMIAIEAHLASELEFVDADPNQMEQVLMNLATNAADAMPEGGRLVIETQNVTLSEAYTRQHLEVRPGRYVQVMVSDTGHGIQPRDLEHIFDPFFTTKEVGKGTGLGLSTVYGIIKSHGGQIYCYSEPGMGSTFKIFLPVRQAGAPEPALEVSLSEQLLKGTETILLVDDEQTLRDLGSITLLGMGYQVLTAATGEECLDIYQAQAERIDLVVMDLGMPGMGGHKALKEILAFNPQARVIIASGYSANGQVKASLESGAAGYVAKPFRRIDLLATVRDVLDRK